MSASPSPSPNLTTPAPDSWRRVEPDEARFTPTRRAWLVEFLARVEARRGLTAEERLLRALAWCGLAAPLEELAVKASVSFPETSPDSARKQVRRLVARLVARELLVTREIPPDFAACTHTELRGKAGRLDCQRQRKARALGETCTAHHGYTLRMLAPGLTPNQLRAGLSLDAPEVTRRVKERREAKEAERLATGRQGNDAEGRKLRGEPVTRGPRGTNHTSPRYLSRRPRDPVAATDVPPHPPEGEEILQTTASFAGEGGDKVVRPPKAGCEGFAPEARVLGSWFVESPPPGPAMGSGRADEGGGSRTTPTPTLAVAVAASSEREREVPTLTPPDVSSPPDLSRGAAANVRRISEARATRAVVDWFAAEWASRGLPALNRLEGNRVLWSRAKQFSREDLALAIRVAVRRAPHDGPATYRRIFADRGVLAELIHEQRAADARAPARAHRPPAALAAFVARPAGLEPAPGPRIVVTADAEPEAARTTIVRANANPSALEQVDRLLRGELLPPGSTL